MRNRSGVYRIWHSLLIAGILLITGHALAAERPSFDLEGCTWNATDIVVVEQVKGELIAVEAWKGGVGKGVIIRLNDFPMAPLKVAAWKADEPNKWVSGKRIVLFLSLHNPYGLWSEVEWKGASRFAEPQVSAVWLENGRAYAFQQLKNPGPSELRLLNADASKFEAETKAMLQAQQALAKTWQIADVQARVAGLVKLATQGSYSQRVEALRRLGLCGEAAVEELRKLSQQNDQFADRAFKALLIASGFNAGNELKQTLVRELAFWKENAGSLEKGWWNKLEPETRREQLHRRCSVLLAAIRASEQPYLSNKLILQSLRAFWASQPQLNDESGRSQIVEECDSALKAFDKPPEPDESEQ